MEEQNKTRVVIYENRDRIPLIDALAQREEVSRAELYRRAMRIYLAMKRAEPSITITKEEDNDRNTA